MEETRRKANLLLLYLLYVSSLFNSTNNEEIVQKYNGGEIKMLAYQFPPFFNYKKHKDGNYTFEGLTYEYMQAAQTYLNLRYKYVIIDEIEVKEYGMVTAMQNCLDKKEVDVVPYLFDQELNNLKHMELATTVWIDPLAIMQPYPKEKDRLYVPIQPFQWMLWITFFGATTVFILTSTAFVRIQGRYDLSDDQYRKSIGKTIYQQLEYVLKITTSQGINSFTFSNKKNILHIITAVIEGYFVRYQSPKSYKILIGFWLISMVVLINAYTSVMTALLTVPKLEPISNTLEEAAIQNRLVTIQTNSPMSRILSDATEGYEKRIGDQLRQDPTLWTADPLAAVDNVLNRKCVYPTAMLLINYIIYQDTKSNGRCRMTVSAELKAYNHLPFQIGFPINSPIATVFDKFFLRMNAAGLVGHYKDKFFPSTRQCRTDVSSKNAKRSLTLFDLTAPFLIVGVGLSLSILAFLIEIVVSFIFDRLDC